MLSRFAKLFFVIILVLLLVSTISFFHPPSRGYIDPWTGNLFGEGGVEQSPHDGISQPGSVHKNVMPTNNGKGSVIMEKLGNATAKAALGRATWKLLHTITLRFPENPTQDERDALKSYLHLTSRLYPCGECAAEFQSLLEKYEPQTSSRRNAALWLCHVHNKVNKRLGKDIFDCAHLDETYDCGCGDTPVGSSELNLIIPDLAKDDVTGEGLIRGG